MKTGGRYIRRNVLTPIITQLADVGIEIIMDEVDAHLGWHSRIDDQTYVFTVVRDPAEQSVSYFAHLVCLDDSGKIKEDYDSSKLNIDTLIHVLNNNPSFPNLQARSYLHDETNRNKQYGTRTSFDHDLFMERKNKVNLFLDFKEIAGQDLAIQKKIFDDLGVDGIPVDYTSRSFYNFESKDLFDSLSDKEKEMIRKYNKIDYDLYKNTEYWHPNS